MNRAPASSSLSHESGHYLDQARIAFLIGAGASVPLGMPTTKSFLALLCDKSANGRLAEELRKSAAYRFRIGKDAVNIEDLLTHLYELQLVVWLARRSSVPSLLAGFTSNSRKLASADKRLEQLQRRVYELLHEKCGDCSGTAADRLWGTVLRYVSSVQRIVPIFNLNYDWTFEKLAIERMGRYQLIDGFELLGGEWNPNRLTATPLPAGKIPICLFKLHGSTDWLPGVPTKSMGHFVPVAESEDGLPPHQFEMVYPGHQEERWLGKEAWQRLNDPEGMFGPWDEREPYKTLHAHMRSVFLRAEVIIVIGYAFHDDRVNKALVEAVNAHRKRRVIVVDPGIEAFDKARGSDYTIAPYDFLTFDRDVTDWSHFDWLPGRFGQQATTRELIRLIKRVLAVNADVARLSRAHN